MAQGIEVWQAERGRPSEVLTVRPQAELGPLAAGSLRLRVLASPVNPMDLLICRGHYPLLAGLPGVPGAEGLAVVEGVGAGLAGWAVGERVLLPVRAGAWRTRLDLGPEGLLRVPAGAEVAAACGWRVNGLSAVAMLEGLPVGAVVVQDAGNGGVGQVVAQLGRARGLRVVSLVRSRAAAEVAEAAGAEVVLASEADEAAGKALRAVIGGRRAARGLCGAGGAWASVLGGAVQEGGQVWVYGGMSRQAPQIALSDSLFRGVELLGFWLYRHALRAGPAWEQAGVDALAEAAVAAAGAERFSLAEVVAACGAKGRALLLASKSDE